MLKKAALAFLFFLLSLAWQAPASLADSLLRRFGQGNFALLGPEGSLWSGSALLAVPDPESARFVPIMHVAWRWQAISLLRGRLAWTLNLEARPPAEISIGLGGPSLRKLEIKLPARYALERIPNAFGRAGWHGDLSLSAPDWHCNWRGDCSGEAKLNWTGVASDLFPRRRFGDYEFAVEAKEGLIGFELKTLAGEIQLQAKGKLEPTGRFQAEGQIQGDPDFVGRLPNISGKLFRPEGPPGRLVFSIGY